MLRKMSLVSSDRFQAPPPWPPQPAPTSSAFDLLLLLPLLLLLLLLIRVNETENAIDSTRGKSGLIFGKCSRDRYQITTKVKSIAVCLKISVTRYPIFLLVGIPKIETPFKKLPRRDVQVSGCIRRCRQKQFPWCLLKWYTTCRNKHPLIPKPTTTVLKMVLSSKRYTHSAGRFSAL